MKDFKVFTNNVYIDKLDDIVNEWNNAYYRAIKMKPVNVKIIYTAPRIYVINNLNSEKVRGTFFEKELLKTNQKEFRIKKVVAKNENKLYVKWKGYDNSF